MSKVIVFTNLTLDGIMQAPGRPDEDRRGDFSHGGWATPYAAMAQAGNSIATICALLLGRRTYQDFYVVWPECKDSPFSALLDLFLEGSTFATLRFVNTKTTNTGVVILTYQPAESEARSTTETLPQG